MTRLDPRDFNPLHPTRPDPTRDISKPPDPIRPDPTRCVRFQNILTRPDAIPEALKTARPDPRVESWPVKIPERNRQRFNNIWQMNLVPGTY